MSNVKEAHSSHVGAVTEVGSGASTSMALIPETTLTSKISNIHIVKLQLNNVYKANMHVPCGGQ
jgi:hypothetical protein